MDRVLLCSQNDHFGIKVLYCLKAAGYAVDVFSLIPNNKMRYSRYVSKYIEPDIHLNPNEKQQYAIEWINHQAKIRNYKAVLADSIQAHGFLNAIMLHLNVPAFAPSPLTLLQECHDKYSFYQKISAAGILTPKSVLLTDLNQLDKEFIEPVGFPLLVKPLNAESSCGIYRFMDLMALKTYLHAPGPYKKLPIILQTFINGPSFTSSFIAVKGSIVYDDTQRFNNDYSRTFIDVPQISELSSQIVKESHYGGPGNIDYVMDEATKKFYALEFNCRFWLSVNLSLWRGTNFPDLAVKLCNDETILPQHTKPGQVFPPLCALKMLKHPLSLSNIDLANWKGIWQSLSDPIPHF